MKLYVGNLSFQSTEEDVKDLFSQFGTVTDAHLIMNRVTGRSRGFAFVTMSSDDEARAAIEGTNGKDFDGRSLTVNEARPMEARKPRRDDGGGRRHSRH
ncbi:MAG: RNA recognition motif domain-containing protein [Chthoniobacterales bacterium]